jgi:ATP phosphoribosyltransferase regulatory subunit
MRYPERVPGTKDYIGSEAEYLLQVSAACARTFERYGYERLILPVLERSDIFLQRSGEEIRSRMYILRDPKGKEICLRPEMTISAARAFLERMSSRRLPIRLSYQGEVFRYDKVREGRYRQFLQAGVEFIGSEQRDHADIETVLLALEAVQEAGLSQCNLLLGDLELASEFINSLPVPASLGDHLVRNFWRQEAFVRFLDRFSESGASSKLLNDGVVDELAEKLSTLGDRASHSLVRQILSLFVEKQIGQRDLDEITERFLQRLTSSEHLRVPKECVEAVKEYLSISGEPNAVLGQVERLMRDIGVARGPAFEGVCRRMELLQKLVTSPTSVELNLGFRRGIEYYTGFIFEIHCPDLGPVSQVCGGGRYDRLLTALGAPRPIPAVGFAIGLERLLLALMKQGHPPKGETTASVDAVLATVGQVPRDTLWKIAQACRRAGWRVRMDVDHRRLGTILGNASEEEIPFVIIAGEDELRDLHVRIRDMFVHAEKVVPIDGLYQYVRGCIEAKGDQSGRSPARYSS